MIAVRLCEVFKIVFYWGGGGELRICVMTILKKH